MTYRTFIVFILALADIMYLVVTAFCLVSVITWRDPAWVWVSLLGNNAVWGYLRWRWRKSWRGLVCLAEEMDRKRTRSTRWSPRLTTRWNSYAVTSTAHTYAG